MFTLYALELTESKWYIGLAVDMKECYSAHQQGMVCEWTRAYPPIRIVSETPIVYTDAESQGDDTDRFVAHARLNERHKKEHDMLVEYMTRYGVDAVRGGPYQDVHLSEFHAHIAKRDVYIAENLCTCCHSQHHKADKCGKLALDCCCNPGEDHNEDDCECYTCECCNDTFVDKTLYEHHTAVCDDPVHFGDCINRHVNYSPVHISHTICRAVNAQIKVGGIPFIEFPLSDSYLRYFDDIRNGVVVHLKRQGVTGVSMNIHHAVAQANVILCKIGWISTTVPMHPSDPAASSGEHSHSH